MECTANCGRCHKTRIHSGHEQKSQKETNHQKKEEKEGYKQYCARFKKKSQTKQKQKVIL
jgi:hypothetical protein